MLGKFLPVVAWHSAAALFQVRLCKLFQLDACVILLFQYVIALRFHLKKQLQVPVLLGVSKGESSTSNWEPNLASQPSLASHPSASRQNLISCSVGHSWQNRDLGGRRLLSAAGCCLVAGFISLWSGRFGKLKTLLSWSRCISLQAS